MREIISAPYRVGIKCTDPDALHDRLLVSGLQTINPELASERGFMRHEAIIPTEPRTPTVEEVAAIIAHEDTRHTIQLLALPIIIGEQVLHLCDNRVPPYVDFKGDKDLGEGFMGRTAAVRVDPPDTLNVSVSTADGLTVGDHIDCAPDPRMQLAILNMGPGERWHRITPAFSRDDMMKGQLPKPVACAAHMKNLLELNPGEDLLTYWIRLDPPHDNGEGMRTDAIVSSPVARYLHDGSTYGAKQKSKVVFISTPPGAQMPQYSSLV